MNRPDGVVDVRLHHSDTSASDASWGNTFIVRSIRSVCGPGANAALMHPPARVGGMYVSIISPVPIIPIPIPIFVPISRPRVVASSSSPSPPCVRVVRVVCGGLGW